MAFQCFTIDLKRLIKRINFQWHYELKSLEFYLFIFCKILEQAKINHRVISSDSNTLYITKI